MCLGYTENVWMHAPFDDRCYPGMRQTMLDRLADGIIRGCVTEARARRDCNAATSRAGSGTRAQRGRWQALPPSLSGLASGDQCRVTFKDSVFLQEGHVGLGHG